MAGVPGATDATQCQSLWSLEICLRKSHRNDLGEESYGHRWCPHRDVVGRSTVRYPELQHLLYQEQRALGPPNQLSTRTYSNVRGAQKWVLKNLVWRHPSAAAGSSPPQLSNLPSSSNSHMKCIDIQGVTNGSKTEKKINTHETGSRQLPVDWQVLVRNKSPRCSQRDPESLSPRMHCGTPSYVPTVGACCSLTQKATLFLAWTDLVVGFDVDLSGLWYPRS